MAIEYSRINFRRRTVQYPRSYTHESNAGGGVTHTPQAGTVIDEGVLPEPENMNYIDAKMKEIVDALNETMAALEALASTVASNQSGLATRIGTLETAMTNANSAISSLTSGQNATAQSLTSEISARKAGDTALNTAKLEEAVYTATIPASGWTGSAAPYTRQITVNGVRAADAPIIDLALTGTYQTDAQIRDAWALIGRITTGADSITVTADAIPAVNIPIKVRCLRHG